MTSKLIACVLCAVSIGLALPLAAQSGSNAKLNATIKADSAAKKPPASTDKEALKSITEVTKRCKRVPGLFPLYQDTVTGTTYMEISIDQIGKEYIYFCMVADGAVPLGLQRGNFRANSVFTIERYFNRIEFVGQNTNYYFDPRNPISKAANANISPAILLSEALAGESADKKTLLIKADGLFLSEVLEQIKPSSSPLLGGSLLGSLSKDKTKYLSLRNYPQNTDVTVEYAYDNSSAPFGLFDATELADARFIRFKVQHSLIEAPKNNFKPRRDDPRIGYFSRQVTDQTSLSRTPFRDMIHRWYLEKKDHKAALSEPLEPITFWIENTTPIEWRPLIKQAGLLWNEAFEKAGFKNAVVIKEQSDTASWDAGDIRYNVLRWTSSPTTSFGGYGPSFVHPRTGQILGADIMLEYTFFTNRFFQSKVFSNAGLELMGGEDKAHEEAMSNLEAHSKNCSAGHALVQALNFGHAAMTAAGMGEIDMKQYTEDAMHYLILHEMGHTLGLMHNMRSSQMLSPDQLMDKATTEKYGVTGSVMDYPASNISHVPGKQGHFFTTKPGPYDLWAIEYGYSHGQQDDEKGEAERLSKIADRSTEPMLAFGNDADDMRTPGKAIDPRVNIYDLSSDAIGFADKRMAYVYKLFPKLKDKLTNKGESYQELRDGYLSLTTELNNCANVVSRYVGGVMMDRSLVGQSTGNKPYTPVAREEQIRALKVLNEHIFGPKAFNIPADVYAYLQPQRRGFNNGKGTIDPSIIDRISNIQNSVLSHILHPATLERITNSELYGNKYSLSEMMGNLTDIMLKEDLLRPTSIVRQGLQTQYVDMLIQVSGLRDKGTFGNGYHDQARAVALYQLNAIRKQLGATVATDLPTKIHRQHLIFKINVAMERK